MTTQALKQFIEFKSKYPEYILFFHKGDFYNLYHGDAETLARVTGRQVVTRVSGVASAVLRGTPEESVTMIGFPADELESILRWMIAAGHKCAICEATK